MLAERLRAAREAANLTQGQLAARIGVDRNTVNRAENSHTAPVASTIAKWARACGVSADSLLDDTGQTETTEVAAATGTPVQGAA